MPKRPQTLETLKRARKGKLREFLDQDYADQLDAETYRYLVNFDREFYLGTKTHGGAVHPRKYWHKSNRENLYQRNNERNRDMWNMAQREDLEE